jgi:hypothetical protein
MTERYPGWDQSKVHDNSHCTREIANGSTSESVGLKRCMLADFASCGWTPINQQPHRTTVDEAEPEPKRKLESKSMTKLKSRMPSRTTKKRRESGGPTETRPEKRKRTVDTGQSSTSLFQQGILIFDSEPLVTGPTDVSEYRN